MKKTTFACFWLLIKLRTKSLLKFLQKFSSKKSNPANPFKILSLKIRIESNIHFPQDTNNCKSNQLQIEIIGSYDKKLVAV